MGLPPAGAGGRSGACGHSQEEAALLEGYLSAVREKQSILEAELLALEVRRRRRSRDGQAGGSHASECQRGWRSAVTRVLYLQQQPGASVGLSLRRMSSRRPGLMGTVAPSTPHPCLSCSHVAHTRLPVPCHAILRAAPHSLTLARRYSSRLATDLCGTCRSGSIGVWT